MVRVVHGATSFGQSPSSLADFGAFLTSLGVGSPDVGSLSEPVDRLGISLRFGWVADTPTS
jgi:hypothetical protein